MLKKHFLAQFVDPRSGDEDSRRREFILNVLLLSSVVLFAVANAVHIFHIVSQPAFYQAQSISFVLLLLVFAFFLALLVLSRKGYFKVSAHILIFTFFLLAAYLGYQWSIALTASLLIYALVIVMAGILVGTRFAFVMTGIIAAVLFIVGYLQSAELIVPNYEWKTGTWTITDTIMTSIIFFVIATVSWLANREIERSLRRARASERDLRTERDMLEVTVEERTRKLKETQMEKIAQLYRFAEFGRLSSGLFHDLMNPLTAVSLNMERARSEKENAGDLSKAQTYLDQAFTAAKRMERFIVSVRKQIGKEKEHKRFFVTEEIKEVIDILSYKAHSANVSLLLHGDGGISMFGNPTLWSQVMLNLITNGIDAYDGKTDVEETREVVVKVSEDKKQIKCTVSDRGIGIKAEHFEKIFEPFFTTKPEDPTKGTGIGLSMVKNIIEKDFRGTIAVTSTAAEGTVFSLALPK